jgi:hypothetical protein
MDRKKIAQELMLVAEELAEADKLRASGLISADEMEPYCADCAAKIRSGSLQMTRDEFRKAIARMVSKKAGWTDEGKRVLWSGLIGDVQAKLDMCVVKLTGVDEDPVKFCSELADKMEPGWRSKG